VRDSPGLEDLWQLHYAEESDREHNVPEDRIANVKENCEGKYLKVVAESDGSFTLTNARTGEEKHYVKK
jgi:competence protein ComEC